MMKTSEKLIRKKTCNYLVGLFSSAKSIATKGKLHLSVISYPLPTISYPYPQLVTLLLKNNKLTHLTNIAIKAFKNKSYPLPTISYPLPTISYPYPQLVTLYPQLVTLLPTISYPLPTISYPFASRKCIAKPKINPLLKLLQNYIKISKTLEVYL